MGTGFGDALRSASVLNSLAMMLMVFRQEKLEEVGNPLLGHSRAPHTGKSVNGRLAGLEGKNAIFQVPNWPLALLEYA